ncbi:DNA cytosine methyltransferase [Salmonella enterica subsp. enterica serovar Typhimurium]|nr:DNA cytosine methyltransferase [Salmonella enterica subsp. enterica serovar Typhimurium]
MREIIVDNFAGGGGASTGIEMAIGHSVDIAINHDPNAIAMHTTNHPDTLHYCESVFTVKPKIVTAGRPVALVWLSPDCRHFSKAKGAKPVEKSIRGLAWIELRWGLEVKPRVMMLENVGEFRTWGPLLAGEMRPDPERTGETFEAFVGMLTTGIPANHPALAECCEFLEIDIHSEQAKRLINGLGYTVEYRELRACDYGAPTIRKRFFMVARCDGQPVVWPEPTHGDSKSEAVKSGRLKPWRTAAECIDWSIPAPSIFGRKKPLAENTLRRIARGIQRFVIDSEQPYIVPFIVKCNHTSSKSEYDCFRGQGLPEPLQTITKKHGYAVAVPHLTKFRTGATGQNVTDPAPTITAGGGGKSQLTTATLIQMGYGERNGQSPRVLRIEKPLGTVTAGGNKFAIATAFLVKHYGGNYTGSGVGLEEPTHSITTVDHHAVVSAHLMVNNTGHAGGAADSPAHTVTTGNHHAVVASHLVKLRGTCRDGQPVSDPMPTITAGGLHVGEVKTTLAVDEYDEHRAQQTLEFLREYCGEDCDGLVDIGGITYRIVDIGMRMLQPRELYRAQGFPDWYIIEHDFRGVKYAKDKQVARCGNAVPPQFAEALVRANLPELCVISEERAA